MKKRIETNRIIFHHSLADKSTVEDIEAWHQHRGFECCGYHFVILRDGTLQNGRDTHCIGAHCLGRNYDSIGVCLEGDFRKYPPTDLQINECLRLYHAVCRHYTKKLLIEFHRELNDPCPGILLDRKKFFDIVSNGY